MKRILSLLTAVVLTFSFCLTTAEAYVNVKGYTRSDGTYVTPHVRSNPNGLKYDNYGWTPSQGLYNKSYGTRGSSWDTPTWITDPNYYEGKSLYESGQSGSSSSYSPSYSNSTSLVEVPTNASRNYYGTGWSCNSGYKRVGNGCEKVVIPANASLNYLGNGWSCNSGYKQNGGSCEKINNPPNSSIYGSNWYCNSGYKKVGNTCEKVIAPDNASIYGSTWYCNYGYRQSGNSCIKSNY
jgi:hypothetical protein